jgi:hypothetical protein
LAEKGFVDLEAVTTGIDVTDTKVSFSYGEKECDVVTDETTYLLPIALNTDDAFSDEAEL